MGLQRVGHDLVTEQQQKCIRPIVLIQNNFSHRGMLAMCESIFNCHDQGGGVLFNGKGCNSKHLTVDRVAPTTQNYLV